MKNNNYKFLAVVGFVGLLFVVIGFKPERLFTVSGADVAAVYKAKCAMCHSPKAEKSYDPAMPMEQQVEAILKGKKAEKPPNMPGFEAKGMTAEQAKSLAEYMKSLRTPAQ